MITIQMKTQRNFGFFSLQLSGLSHLEGLPQSCNLAVPRTQYIPVYLVYRDKIKRYQERHRSWVLAGVPYQNVAGKLQRSVSSSTSFDRNSRNGSQVRDNDGNDDHILYIGADSDSQ